MNNVKNSSQATQKWLSDERYQVILRATHTVVFEYNPQTREQSMSPFVNEYIAGNYEGRLLSRVFVEDNIVHPDDLETALEFREKASIGVESEVVLRLLTPKGNYHWFKMCLRPFKDNETMIYIGTITDIDKEMSHRKTPLECKEYDLTTGIYTKPTYYSVTERWLRDEPDMERCLVQFDIDRFKIVNELYSLAEGDKVLCFIADFLRNNTKPPETFCRISADIFSMCLARPKEEARKLLHRLELQLEKYPLDFQFSLSAGIVCIEHYNNEPINVLCDQATVAQRTVKGNFINHFAYYDETMFQALNKEHYIVKNMKEALESGQFIIYLQPKYDMRDCSIIGAEALARWMHPKDGLISPGDFIPLFERNGFILQLDEYIWELACKTLREWLDKGYQPVPLSVNVSRLHLYDTDFCDKLLALINKYDLPPELLELEITESAYTENPQTLYGIMDRLQEAGFLFSMDDFGSGYSSLNILKDIPVNLVKIDLNFLQQARRGIDVGRDILKGTIQLIHNIDLPVIAEGVESAEQAQFLLNAGCVHAQGYYYAKPMPIADFESLMWK